MASEIAVAIDVPVNPEAPVRKVRIKDLPRDEFNAYMRVVNARTRNKNRAAFNEYHRIYQRDWERKRRAARAAQAV